MPARYIDDDLISLREQPPTPSVIACTKEREGLRKAGYPLRPKWKFDGSNTALDLAVPEVFSVGAQFDDVDVEGIVRLVHPVPIRATDLLLPPEVHTRLLNEPRAMVAGFEMRGDATVPRNCAIWIDGDRRILEVIWFGALYLRGRLPLVLD